MEDVQFLVFGELLKAFRKQRQMTQHELATRIGTHRNTIGTWERGDFLPESRTIVLEVAHQLCLDKQDTRSLLEASLTGLSPYWHMPYRRNAFFTGREEVLQQLYHALKPEQNMTHEFNKSYTLNGMGGIGKTQTAIEYAYRYANDYTAIFWISAETYETIISSFRMIADLLDLPEKQEQKQDKLVFAVVRWLTNHRNWLLLFDNVEDPAVVKQFLPPARSGSLLFTSRRQSLGLVTQALGLEQMTLEEGIRFLLHRARLLDPAESLDSLSPAESTLAQDLVTIMDGLPLALDQAGVYIEETQCGLADYVHLFQSSQQRLLDEREAHADHPQSVAKTFTLSFGQLERSSPAAAEFLIVCAFLAPDAIPEMLFLEGAIHLGPTFEALATDPLQFQSALKALLSYSLLQRNPVTRTLTIHRLVQVVLKGYLSVTEQHQWAIRVINAITQLFPSEKMQANYWHIGEQLLPHAQACLLLAEQWNEPTIISASLMSNVALYLSLRARYTEAGPLYQRALALREQELGAEHPLVAEILYRQALLFKDQGNYQEAERLYQRALTLREHSLGAKHPLVAEAIAGLAALHRRQGEYTKAEPLFQQAIQIGEQSLGFEHPQIAVWLNDLANTYAEQGKYTEAEPLLQRALRIWEQTLGPEHSQLAYPLVSLANISQEQSKYEQSRMLNQRALRIWEKALGLEHPLVAYPLNSLGVLYREQGQYAEAEPPYQRALRIWGKAWGPKHPELAYPLYGLAEIFREQRKFEQAKDFYQQALQIREQGLRAEHPLLADPLTGLATLYRDQGNYEEAKPLYQRALALRAQHPDAAETMHQFARFYQMQQQMTEALSLYHQALTIREKALGPEHPKTKQIQTDYAHLLAEMEKEEDPR